MACARDKHGKRRGACKEHERGLVGQASPARQKGRGNHRCRGGKRRQRDGRPCREGQRGCDQHREIDEGRKQDGQSRPADAERTRQAVCALRPDGQRSQRLRHLVSHPRPIVKAITDEQAMSSRGHGNALGGGDLVGGDQVSAG